MKKIYILTAYNLKQGYYINKAYFCCVYLETPGFDNLVFIPDPWSTTNCKPQTSMQKEGDSEVAKIQCILSNLM